MGIFKGCTGSWFGFILTLIPNLGESAGFDINNAHLGLGNKYIWTLRKQKSSERYSLSG